MHRTAPYIASAVSIFLAGTAIAQLATSPAPASRPVETILADMEKVPQPEIDMQRQADPAYKPEIEAKIKAYLKQTEPFRDEVIQSHPEHELAGVFLRQKLSRKFNEGASAKDVIADAEKYIEKYPKLPVGDAGLMIRATLQLGESFTYGQGTAAIKPLIERFGEQDQQVAEIKYLVLERATDLPTDKRISLIKLYIEENAGSPYAEMATGRVKQFEGVGKPFELSFKEFTSGKTISMPDLKGKVVLIDFWATWCGPCIQELPELQKVYEKNKDKGFEVIGVSLDFPEADGGKAALTTFLAQNKLPWPIYYQGNGFEGEFTRSWSIMAIPQLFLVDKEGKLASVDVHSGNLEQQVAKLLGN